MARPPSILNIIWHLYSTESVTLNKLCHTTTLKSLGYRNDTSLMADTERLLAHGIVEPVDRSQFRKFGITKDLVLQITTKGKLIARENAPRTERLQVNIDTLLMERLQEEATREQTTVPDVVYRALKEAFFPRGRGRKAEYNLDEILSLG